MEVLNIVIKVLSTAITVLSAYKILYVVIGVISKPKTFESAPAGRKYALVVAARNEEAVLGKLLESLCAQTYPKELLQIFVVADNCTDSTADIARRYGASVYERHEPERARKGYALNFLFKQIKRDYGIESFDGYLFFDADNVVNSDYVEQMNNAFASGADAVVGYRNAKNFSQNFVSAAYGMHFMGASISYHRPRSRLSLSTHIAGTGYLLSSALIKDGWNFELLTEDTQATLSFIRQGKRIEYCEAAELYDEQPTRLRTVFRQRLRWSKGRMACFFLNAFGLIGGIFKTAGRRFSCYDMFFYVFPGVVFTAAMALVKGTATLIDHFVSGSAVDIMPKTDIKSSLIALAVSALVGYASHVIRGVLIAVRERKHINCPTKKLVFYVLIWPWFDVLNGPITLACLFMHISWKPIKHDAVIDIKEIGTSR